MSIEEIQHDNENLFVVVELCDMDLKNYFDSLEDMIPPNVSTFLYQLISIDCVNIDWWLFRWFVT